MSQGQSFIRPNLIVEPLVDRFYAWLYTVAPIQGAMNLTFLQVPLLESYLQSPQAHVLASTNPELRGGYFVGIEEARKDEVKALLDSIRKDRADMLKLAQAVADAEDAVRQGATSRRSIRSCRRSWPVWSRSPTTPATRRRSTSWSRWPTSPACTT
jgi:hypothetical protein